MRISAFKSDAIVFSPLEKSMAVQKHRHTLLIPTVSMLHFSTLIGYSSKDFTLKDVINVTLNPSSVNKRVLFSVRKQYSYCWQARFPLSNV